MQKLIAIISMVVLIGCKENHTVKRTVDGDTIVLDDDTRIRIKNIDSPELSQPYGKDAKRFTDSVLTGKEITVIYSGQSSYNRKVAEIYINGLNFADIIVSNGFAHVSKNYCSDPNIIEEYNEARKHHKGLFASDYILPYLYRRKQHK